MTVLTRGARPRRGGRRPGWVLLTVLLVLAIAASSALVFTNRVELLKLAVILSLWAAVAAAFVSVIYRRQSDIDQAKARDLKLVYDLQLDREISARREYELSLETHLRRELASELQAQQADEVSALRAELAALRTNLEILFDTDLAHRPALETERTTVRALSDWEREPQPDRRFEMADDVPDVDEDSAIIDVAAEPHPPESEWAGPAAVSAPAGWGVEPTRDRPATAPEPERDDSAVAEPPRRRRRRYADEPAAAHPGDDRVPEPQPQRGGRRRADERWAQPEPEPQRGWQPPPPAPPPPPAHVPAQPHAQPEPPIPPDPQPAWQPEPQFQAEQPFQPEPPVQPEPQFEAPPAPAAEPEVRFPWLPPPRAGAEPPPQFQPEPQFEAPPEPEFQPPPEPEFQPQPEPESQPQPEPQFQEPPYPPPPAEPEPQPEPAGGWQPAPAEGQWIPPGAPGSNWVAPVTPEPAPADEYVGRRRAPEPADTPVSETPRGRHWVPAESPAAEAQPPTPLDIPPEPPAPRSRRRAAESVEDGQHTGGQSVADLLARLQANGTTGGRRRRSREE